MLTAMGRTVTHMWEVTSLKVLASVSLEKSSVCGTEGGRECACSVLWLIKLPPRGRDSQSDTTTWVHWD